MYTNIYIYIYIYIYIIKDLFAIQHKFVRYINILANQLLKTIIIDNKSIKSDIHNMVNWCTQASTLVYKI